jgi:hypothetical protein
MNNSENPASNSLERGDPWPVAFLCPILEKKKKDVTYLVNLKIGPVKWETTLHSCSTWNLFMFSNFSLVETGEAHPIFQTNNESLILSLYRLYLLVR